MYIITKTIKRWERFYEAMWRNLTAGDINSQMHHPQERGCLGEAECRYSQIESASLLRRLAGNLDLASAATGVKRDKVQKELV